MNTIVKCTTIAMIVLSLLAAPFGVMAADNLNQPEEKSSGAMAADAIILRPFGLVSMVAGFAFFCISSPFSAAGGNIDDAWDKLVKKPAAFTFARPLGEF